MKKVTKKIAGFSLVELMVVVAIIGILAAVAIPQYGKFQSKARQAEAKANLGDIHTKQVAFRDEWRQFFADFAETGINFNGVVNYRTGFSGAGSTNAPADPDWNGMIAAGMAATCYDTSTGSTGACSGAMERPGACALAGADVVSAADAFQAGTCGNIDGDTGSDVWNITQAKVLSNPTMDLD